MHDEWYWFRLLNGQPVSADAETVEHFYLDDKGYLHADMWLYDPAKGYSKARNSPWAGRTLTGRAAATIVGGRLVYDAMRGILV